MKRNLPYLFLGFVLFFHVANISLVVPSLIHGNRWNFHFITTNFPDTYRRLLEVVVSFGLALLTYLSFYFGSRRNILLTSVFLSLTGTYGYFCHFVFHPFIHGSDYQRTISLILAELYILYGAVFFIVGIIRQNRKQKKLLEQEKRNAELAFLRSQINPHFLFNSLNNIYSLVYDKSPSSLQAISDLSDLMRYMLYIREDKVPITEELSYISKYIALQRLRFEHSIKTEISIDHVSDKVEVPPLLFIPFVENAFKHGDFSSSEEGINVNCFATKKQINFSIRNKIKVSGSKDEDSGIGLQNVQKRLDLLYPDRHSLNITEADSFFQIQLAIPNE